LNRKKVKQLSITFSLLKIRSSIFFISSAVIFFFMIFLLGLGEWCRQMIFSFLDWPRSGIARSAICVLRVRRRQVRGCVCVGLLSRWGVTCRASVARVAVRLRRSISKFTFDIDRRSSQ
jgi:hypothetical protein